MPAVSCIVINLKTRFMLKLCADPEGLVDKGSGPPEKSQRYTGFLSNTGPDLLKISKLPDRPAFNVGPSSALQRDAI